MARDHHLAGQILEQVQERDMVDLLVVEAIAPCRMAGRVQIGGDRCRPAPGPETGTRPKRHGHSHAPTRPGSHRQRPRAPAHRGRCRSSARARWLALHQRTAPQVALDVNAVRRHQRNQRLAQTARRLRPEISHAPLPSHESATHRRPILWSQETINDAAAETRPRRPPASSSRGQERGTWVVT